MRKALVGALAAVSMALGGVGAQAATVGTTPTTNNVLGEMEGWFGADLYLIAGAGGANIKLEFLGKEAGFTNSFNFGGVQRYITSVFGNAGAPAAGLPAWPGSTVFNFNNVASGLLDFEFFSPLGSVKNGNNGTQYGAAGVNFFISLSNNGLGDTNINGSTPGGGLTAILALDDRGAGPDDNHDDLVVRLTITGNGCVADTQNGCNPPNEIPEPSTYALLLAGLLGLGFIARRRTQP